VNGTYEYKLLYSGQLSPVARLNANDEIVEQYVYGTRVNVPDYMVKNGRKYRILTDHKGSVRMVVDTHDMEIVQQTEYSEFGIIIDEELAEGWTPVLFGYAGGLQDRDTGLVKFGARDYDPEVGRWTSKEPLGFNGATNFYVYAGNDPVNKVDINGLETTAIGYSIDIAAIVHFGFSGHIVFDDKWNVGIRGTYETGGNFTATASATFEYEWTNADTVHDLKGKNLCVGGSASVIHPFITAGVDYVHGLGDSRYHGFALNGGLSVKSPIPFELHGTTEYSEVASFNLKSAFYALKNKAESFIKGIFD